MDANPAEVRSAEPLTVEPPVEEKPVVAPEPPRALTRFEQLPSAVELPSSLERETQLLAPLEGEPEEIKWSLESSAADIPDGAFYYIDPDKDDISTWYISYASDPIKTSDNKIARIVEEPDSLTFQWANTPGIDVLKDQLRNCLLQASSKGRIRFVQLRAAMRLGVERLNLQESSTPLELELSSLPKTETLVLEMDPLGAGDFESGITEAALGKDLLFEFEEPEGAKLSARVVYNKSTNALSLRLNPIFQEKGRRVEFELTRTKLAEMKDVWVAAGQKAIVSLQQAQSVVSACQNRLEALGPKPTSDSLLIAAWSRQYQSITGQMKSAADRIPSAQRRIAEMKARVNAIPLVESFINQYHNSEIRYRVFAKAGDQRILLIDAR